MDVTPKKWSTQKIVAIALMALAFLMLNVSWIKIDSDALEAVDEMRDDLEEELEWIEEEYDDFEEYLDDVGFSKKEIKTAKKALEATEDMVDTLGEGKYSVWSAVSIMSFCGKAKILFEEEDSFWYDEEALEVIGYLQLIFGIIIGVFALAGLLMILAIVSHIGDKRGLGIPAVIFSLLLLLAFGFLHLALNVDGSMGGITLAPVLTCVFAIASCVAWAGARKQITKKD